MKAISKAVAIGVSVGVLVSAAPAPAQSYGYGYPHPNGYGGYTQIAINQCAYAVQARLDASHYGYPGWYAYNGARVLGITGVFPRGYGSAVTVQGVANSGRDRGYSYATRTPVDLMWRCTTDNRGMVSGITVQADRGTYNYNYDSPARANDYSQYGYRRY